MSEHSDMLPPPTGIARKTRSDKGVARRSTLAGLVSGKAIERWAGSSGSRRKGGRNE